MSLLFSFKFCFFLFFFFNDTATTEIYTLSLHDALPIYQSPPGGNTPRQFPSHLLAIDQSRIRNSRSRALCPCPTKISRIAAIRFGISLPLFTGAQHARAVQQIHQTMAYCILGDKRPWPRTNSHQINTRSSDGHPLTGISRS